MIFAKGVSEEGGRRNRWAAKGFNDGSKEGLGFPAKKKKKKIAIWRKCLEDWVQLYVGILVISILQIKHKKLTI